MGDCSGFSSYYIFREVFVIALQSQLFVVGQSLAFKVLVVACILKIIVKGIKTTPTCNNWKEVIIGFTVLCYPMIL